MFRKPSYELINGTLENGTGIRKQLPPLCIRVICANWLVTVFCIAVAGTTLLFVVDEKFLSRFSFDFDTAFPDTGIGGTKTAAKDSIQVGDSSTYDTLLDVQPPWTSKVTAQTASPERSKLLSLECRLPDIDPWDRQVSEYLDPSNNPMKGCNKTVAQITWMSKGYVVLDEAYKENDTKCEFSCCYPKDDFELHFGAWKDIWYEPDCDILQVRCKDDKGEVFYEYLHSQIYRRVDYGKTRRWRTSTVPSEDIHVYRPPELDLSTGREHHRAPDVHIILFDSVSSPQFYRSMQETVHVLREEMGAVPFRFLNKVGLNSRPNGYALLLGKQGYQMEASPLNEEHVPATDMDTFCGIYLEKEPFIGYEFQKAGYKTMMSEDWAEGVFNWPDCYGFAKPPVDHYMRPFQLFLEKKEYRDDNWTMYYRVYRDSCKEPHQYQLDYLKDFIDAYEEEPKFSLTWMSCVAHDDVNGLYHIDHEWHRFLRSYKEQLKNSFLFVMGDHGNRFGYIRDTKQGELEDNNPAMLVVVPEHMRNNKQLMDNLRSNSRHLTTHYDTYATLLSIAKESKAFSSQRAFAKQPPAADWDAELLGQSYLYPFNLSTPRNCGNLLIPFEYCICQFKSESRTKDKQSLATRLANHMVDLMNHAFEVNNATHLCMPLELDNSTEVELIEWEPKLKTNVYHVTYQTLPGEGRFWGYIQVFNEDDKGGKETFKMISEKMPRLNAYEEQAFCVDSPKVKSYCYCRDFSTTTSTTPALTTQAPEVPSTTSTLVVTSQASGAST